MVALEAMNTSLKITVKHIEMSDEMAKDAQNTAMEVFHTFKFLLF